MTLYKRTALKSSTIKILRALGSGKTSGILVTPSRAATVVRYLESLVVAQQNIS